MHGVRQGALPTMTAESAGMALPWHVRGIRGWLDRALAVGYRVVYDYVYPRFSHYQRLQAEIRDLVEKAVPPRLERREVRVLDVGCGPGNFACALAEAGFNVTGLDSYAPLVGSAKGKRRARHLANLAFRQGELTRGNTFRDGAFDQVVSTHALYALPPPAAGAAPAGSASGAQAWRVRGVRESHAANRAVGDAAGDHAARQTGGGLPGSSGVSAQLALRGAPRARRAALLGRGDVLGAARTGRVRG